MNNDLHFSSNTDEWETPQTYFDVLNNEFRFSVDLCATTENAKCTISVGDIDAYYKNTDTSGLTYWINPPYSRGSQYKCIKIAKKIAEQGNIVVCLIPAKTDTKLWHDLVWNEKTNTPHKNTELRLIKGRLKFELGGKPVLDKKGKPQSAPFPSALVIFNDNEDARLTHTEK